MLTSLICTYTSYSRIIKALATQNAETRVKISRKYKDMYGKELKDVLKKECGGDLGQALQFLAVPLDQAECAMLQKAFKVTGTNEKVLYPILCGRSNEEITILKKTYFNEYTKDLGSVLNSEVGGDLEKILLNCLQGVQEAFDPEFHTAKKAEDDVVDLYKAGQGNFLGTSEKKLFKILCASPPEYLEKVNLLYAEKYGYTLFKALEKELHGDSEDAAMFTLGMKLKPYATVAKLIKESCAGLGSNELLLTCTLIRYQAIMKNVQEAYIELFGEVSTLLYIHHDVNVYERNLMSMFRMYRVSRTVSSPRPGATTKSCWWQLFKPRLKTKHRFYSVR
jgi:hypothetical protein